MPNVILIGLMLTVTCDPLSLRAVVCSFLPQLYCLPLALTPPITAAVWLSASYLASATLFSSQELLLGHNPCPWLLGRGR